MTNYFIIDIITDPISWSCFITLHIMFASCSYICMHPTKIEMIFFYVIDLGMHTYLDYD